ncbi:MAG: hypothetical protein PHZ05_02355 [Pygmaiobacter massiliensis]|nr:hypothetical protein [Pygmaiobacter massiliensis]
MNLLILGAGGYGQTIYELVRACGTYEKVAFLDDKVNGAQVLGRCAEFERFKDEYQHIYPAFGNNEIRMRWAQQIVAAGYTIPTLVHPTAYVSPTARLGQGTAVLPKAIINTHAVTGANSLINCGAILDHDCIVGEGTHIGLGAIVKANCRVQPLVKIEAAVVVQE